MYLLDEVIECKSRSDRIEIFPIYDVHIGKRNCAEHALAKQLKEIIRRSQMPNRHVRVLLGGDQMNAINPVDVRRFDFNELADFFVEGDAVNTRERLSNMVDQEVGHAVELFEPVKQFIVGALEGNHEKSMKTHQNVSIHNAFCTRLGVVNLTDEALIRLTIKRRPGSSSQVVIIYLRHGYGAGRTPGAEPNKLARMLAEWEIADVCLSGHSHSYCILPPKPVLYIPRRGKLPQRIHQRYRFAANPGCWLHSHHPGPSTYESMAAYPAKPMMTLKIVIWPFWSTRKAAKGEVTGIERPKIELREYPIL